MTARWLEVGETVALAEADASMSAAAVAVDVAVVVARPRGYKRALGYDDEPPRIRLLFEPMFSSWVLTGRCRASMMKIPGELQLPEMLIVC